MIGFKVGEKHQLIQESNISLYERVEVFFSFFFSVRNRIGKISIFNRNAEYLKICLGRIYLVMLSICLNYINSFHGTILYWVSFRF